MWHFHNSTFNTGRLEDVYIDYCFEYCQQIIKEYRLNGGNTEWAFPAFCLKTFLRSGPTLMRYRFVPIEKAYIKACIDYLEEHGTSLWQDYKEDPHYKQEIARSYLWIRAFKIDKRFCPPRNYKELDLMFAAAECFMLIGDKNLLEKNP
jgi:hypothetical protein